MFYDYDRDEVEAGYQERIGLQILRAQIAYCELNDVLGVVIDFQNDKTMFVFDRNNSEINVSDNIRSIIGSQAISFYLNTYPDGGADFEITTTAGVFTFTWEPNLDFCSLFEFLFG